MRIYLLVLLVAAAVTFLVTPSVRRLAVRIGAITAVRERDVHTTPIPRLGGLAMLVGLAVALLFASRMPFLARVFTTDGRAWAILGGAAIVCLLGVADDIWDLDWMTKLAGQILAAGFLAWQNVQLFTIPIFGLTRPSARLTLIATVLIVVVAINAVNFVDGLDGLAAGMIAIGGSAFFVYSYALALPQNDYASLATLIMAALVGICLGFLPHNFNPARIFMGDSGSMVLGFVMAAAAIVVTGNIDPGLPQSRQIPAFIPILLPLAVLLLPLFDMGSAIARRTLAGVSPFHPDRQHLHHRMLALGHSHRRAVVILYLWTAIFAFATVALVQFRVRWVLAGLGIAMVIGILLTLGPLRTRGRFLDDTIQIPVVAPPAGAAAEPGSGLGSASSPIQFASSRTWRPVPGPQAPGGADPGPAPGFFPPVGQTPPSTPPAGQTPPPAPLGPAAAAPNPAVPAPAVPARVATPVAPHAPHHVRGKNR